VVAQSGKKTLDDFYAPCVHTGLNKSHAIGLLI